MRFGVPTVVFFVAKILYVRIFSTKAKHSYYSCHFISGRGCDIDVVKNYKKDLHKYKISSSRIKFFFWIDGDEDHLIEGIDVKGKGKNYNNLLSTLGKLSPNNTFLSCTDDRIINLFLILLKLIFSFRLLYYNISLTEANEAMIPNFKWSFKAQLAKKITHFLYRYSDITTFTRIMSHEVLYRGGKKAFKKYISTDHSIRSGIEDLVEVRKSANINTKVIAKNKYIGLVTRFENMKRSEDGIEAFLKTKAFSSGAILNIYGGGSLLQAAKRKFVNKQINFCGEVSQADIIKTLSSCSFIIAPHSGGVSIEAGVAEKAIIVYGCNAMPEYVIDKYTGFLIDLGDIDDFSAHIDKLYFNKQLRKRLASNASRYISERFSRENIELSHRRLAKALENFL